MRNKKADTISQTVAMLQQLNPQQVEYISALVAHLFFGGMKNER